MPTLAIIAPSGYAPNPLHIDRAIARLKERGWHVKNYVNSEEKYQRFSADDATRLGQLYAAVDDAEVDVIMALRGGYGLSRLVDRIDFHRLAASKKLFVGFSDFTLLQLAMLAKTGAISFAGPMIYEDLGSEITNDYLFQQFEQCITTAHYGFHVAVEGNAEVHVDGVFWGGNLSMLAHLVGTPYMPSIQNGILFVEDVNENPYRVERMLMQLHHSGILAQQKALVLGQFTEYKSSHYDNGYDFQTMLDFLRSTLSLPIITGLPFGHTPNKVTLPIGANVNLKSDASSLGLQFRDYPNLSS